MSALLLVSGTAQSADSTFSREQHFGEYVVHFNAFNSTFLIPDIARSYGIERAPDQALLNITILKQGKAVKADLQVEAANLLGQKNKLKPWLIDEGSAKYYLASFKITNDEVLHITIMVKPEGSAARHTIRFSQKFYED